MAMSQKTVLLTLVIVVVLATFLRVQDLSWETYSYSEVEMKQAMHAQGQITMRQDGVLKVLAGVTDFPEVERVVGET